MNQQNRVLLIHNLKDSRQQMSDLLLTVANDQDWRPDKENWSFRYIAAHMAACDKECLLVRIQQIVSGENPYFEYYSNTERDFGTLDLKRSLAEWDATRQEIINFFHSLSDEKLKLTGNHKTFGIITASDYLEIGLGHDREHLQELKQMLTEYNQRQKEDLA
jgi:DinB superfamily